MKHAIPVLLIMFAGIPMAARAFPRHCCSVPKARASAPKAVKAPKLGPVYHSGYVNKSGTYVQPHLQTAPNATKLDNWSSKPNVNPITRKEGTKDPYAAGH